MSTKSSSTTKNALAKSFGQDSVKPDPADMIRQALTNQTFHGADRLVEASNSEVEMNHIFTKPHQDIAALVAAEIRQQAVTKPLADQSETKPQTDIKSPVPSIALNSQQIISRALGQ